MSFVLPLISGAASLFKAIRGAGDADAPVTGPSIRVTSSQPSRPGGVGAEAAGGSFAEKYRARLAKEADSNGDGLISRDELAQQLAKGGASAAAIEQKYQAMDKNGDGKVSVDELKDANALPVSPVVQHVLQMIDARRAAAGGTSSS